MSCCSDTFLKKLISELQSNLSQGVLLFTADGFAYYAHVKKIIDHRIALLEAGAGQNQVIIRHPDQTFCPQGGSVIQEDFTFLDLCKVVAVTAPLFSIPTNFAISVQ